MRKLAIGLFAAGIVGSSALAGDDTTITKDKAAVPMLTPCFKDQEFQIDLYGSITELSSGNREGLFNTPRRGGGGGLGADYFFIKYIGIGIDGDVSSAHKDMWSTTGKIIFRLPFDFGGLCVAPYVYAGGGGIFANNQYGNDSANVGAFVLGGGLEYRFTPRFGFFAEGKYSWASDSGSHPDLSNATGRFGFKITF
jgi:hypothetical protein